MKIKTKQTTVWQIELSLKNNRLIDNMFNLVLLEKLYVTDLHEFIKGLIKKKGFKIYEIDKKLGMNKDYIGNKIRNKRGIPVYIIKKILKILKYEYNDRDLLRIFLKNNSRFYYCERSGGSVPIKLPIHIKGILNNVKYLKPDSYKPRVYLLTKNKKEIKNVLSLFSIKKFSRRKDGVQEINCITLNKFITYFFNYEKKYLIKIPKSNIYSYKKVDILRGVVLPLLLTDGNTYHNKYIYYFDFFSVPKNKELHDIFLDSLYKILKKYPTAYFQLKGINNLRKTSFIVDKNTAKNIIKICKTTKTSPAKNQKPEDYLKEIQPSINFLFNCNKETKIMALRLWFCAEGSISFNRARSRNMIRPHLNLSCSNPILVKQLKKLLGEFSIKMIVRKNDDHWSDIDGLYATRMESILNFLKIDGFLPKVYVWGSKFHRGVEKQKLLLGILEYIDRERKGIYKRKTPIEKVHKEINKIIKLKFEK